MLKFQSLEITRTSPYATPANALQGVLELVDDGKGKITVSLDHSTLIAIMDVVKGCTAERAKQLAKATTAGLADAVAEISLAQDQFLSLPSQE